MMLECGFFKLFLSCDIMCEVWYGGEIDVFEGFCGVGVWGLFGEVYDDYEGWYYLILFCFVFVRVCCGGVVFVMFELFW